MSVELQLKAYAERVNVRLAELLPGPDIRPAQLHEAMRYAVLAPGKRLRPALCMCAAEAVGGNAASALDVACALEMIHAFSLVHDDLPALDNDDLRRGRPTCHVKFGEAVAILAGDALFAHAFTVAATSVPANLAARVISVISRASHDLVRGETDDILSEGKPTDEETLRFIHHHKTGALIAASCELGAILGGGSEAQIDSLRTYGTQVGLAFQIADDILNETSTAEQLGKAAGSDRDRQKATYPALFGLQTSRQMALDAAQVGCDSLCGLPGTIDQLVEFARFSVVRLH